MPHTPHCICLTLRRGVVVDGLPELDTRRSVVVALLAEWGIEFDVLLTPAASLSISFGAKYTVKPKSASFKTCSLLSAKSTGRNEVIVVSYAQLQLSDVTDCSRA